MRQVFGRASCLLLLLPIVGCHKLTFEKSESLDVSEVKKYAVDPPRVKQNVRVVATSSECPVSVYVVLDENAPAVEDAIQSSTKPAADKVLGGADKQQEATVDATIPAKSGFTILVGGATKKTNITVKLTET